jgi:hypothetical protein
MATRIQKSETAHWARVQAQVIGSFKFWSKSKVSPEFVVSLASQIADMAVVELRNRSQKGDRS